MGVSLGGLEAEHLQSMLPARLLAWKSEKGGGS